MVDKICNLAIGFFLGGGLLVFLGWYRNLTAVVVIGAPIAVMSLFVLCAVLMYTWGFHDGANKNDNI